MSLSAQAKSSPVWPLGCIIVPTPGNTVNIMSLVDPNNNNSPENPIRPGFGAGSEYSPTCHKIFLQGYHAAANNNGMVVNSGNVYLCVAPAGNGAGGRADSGSIVFVLAPGQAATWPSAEVDLNAVSPYRFLLDADSANDGALIALQVA